MEQETGPAREPRTTTDNPGLVFITYDQVPYPHHLTRANHTSDFIYRGPALDTSLQAQASSEMHLFNLAAGKGIAGTFSPGFLNASGITTEPDENDVLADAVHIDSTYTSSPTKRIYQVKLQDWVNRNLEGEYLDIAFWAPLARLLDHVKGHWMEKGDDGVDERSYYEIVVRSVKFRVPKGVDTKYPFWHTEWWYPDPGQMQQPGPLSAANDYYHEPGSSGYAHPMSPTEGPNIYNTVDLNNPLFQHLPATSSPTSPTFPDSSGDADAPAGRDSPGSMPSVASSPSDRSRSEQFASDQLPSTPPPLTSPTSLLSSPGRPACIFNRISVSPSSSMEVEPSIDEAGTHGTPAIRIVAPLAGPGMLFINEPWAVAALVTRPNDGSEHAVRAPKQGELAVWRVGCSEKGYGLVYAAPSMTTFEPTKGELVGCDRVFVSLVVGTEEQVRMRGSRS